jgi:hypothetical protein
MAHKKQILLFVYEGFRDHEISGTLSSISQTNQFLIRTIAIDKGVKRSSSGLLVLPDLDFIPEVDLKDMDALNTALLILPGGSMHDEKMKIKISLLANHCINEGIPVVTSRDVMHQLSFPRLHNTADYEDEAECRHFIFDTLNIHPDRNILTDLPYEGVMFG